MSFGQRVAVEWLERTVFAHFLYVQTYYSASKSQIIWLCLPGRPFPDTSSSNLTGQGNPWEETKLTCSHSCEHVGAILGNWPIKNWGWTELLVIPNAQLSINEKAVLDWLKTVQNELKHYQIKAQSVPGEKGILFTWSFINLVTFLFFTQDYPQT